LMFCASWMTKFSSMSNSPPTSCNRADRTDIRDGPLTILGT
jgi:hypothetical protein